MAKRIVWTSKADIVFTKLLEFYCERNGSKTYSRKLNKEIKTAVKLLSKYPLLGIKTNQSNLYMLIKGHFKIFYEPRPNEIVIHLIWDTRQNPSSLEL
ncbi:type II toxin-antitoxin system RelE/ParE family toxin [Flagellimonas sp. HSM57]|uniref:type II toxin-antitoxin system RelE/ParE family toxin n=1 Tax=unclassified Flagellimonas TaxID=2644544 RepID=UPI0013D54C1C|nr:type II toxin-antitoxin system RelE/ParE family toxin [Flagellimonas sp. HSM57]